MGAEIPFERVEERELVQNVSEYELCRARTFINVLS